MSETHNIRKDHGRVLELIMAGWGSQVVRTLATLSVAEHLESEELNALQIADRESSDPAMTHRVLRAGVVLGLLKYDSDKLVFVGTPMLRVLHGESPFSLKYYAQAAIGPAFWLPALLMPEAVAKGENRAREALGTDLFSYFAHNQDESRKFAAAMSNISSPVIDEAVSIIDVAEARLAVDVGGANGAFVSALVQHNAQLSGVVFDLPHVVAGVADELERRALPTRITGVSGDFFSSIPSADIYLLKFVLHDWDDESCIRILGNIRNAMNPGARLFIVEMMIANDAVSTGAALMDVAMLASNTGQERDFSQFEKLLDSAHLTITRVAPVGDPYYLIEIEASDRMNQPRT